MEKNIKNTLKIKRIKCIVLVAILFVLNTVFYVGEINKANDAVDVYSDYVLNNFMRQHNSELSNIENLAFSILYSTMMDKLIEYPSDNSAEGELIQMIINSIVTNKQNSLINDTYVFINKKDLCLSENGLYSLEPIYNQRFRKYFEAFEQWEEAFFKSDVKEYKYIKSDDGNNKLFFIHKYVSKKLEQPAAVVIDINIDKFNAFLQKNLNNQDENIYIINESGDRVFYAYYSGIIDFAKTDKGIQKSGNEKYIIKSVYSENNMWQYVHIMPKEKNNTLHILFITFYFLCLIIGVLISEIVSKRDQVINQQPIQCNNSDLISVSETSPSADEEPIINSELYMNGRIVKIINYIEANYSNHDLNVRLIAEEFGISANYLSAYFKKQTGESLSDYITKHRIKISKKLLNENLLVKEVAYHSGFSDSNVYIRAFKKFEGVTPSQYRLKN